MPLPRVVTPIKRQTMNQDVCARLRRWILDGDLLPGEVIRDLALAQQLGVSRTPVREALLCLEAEGLVETSRNRWTRVTPISIEAAEEIYPIVEALEGLALRTQAPLGPELASILRGANRKLAKAISGKNALAAVDTDADFHRSIVAGSNNSELIATAESLAKKLRRIELAYFSRFPMARASVAEHDQVVAAVERNDVCAAVAALSANWRNSLQRLKAMAPHQES